MARIGQFRRDTLENWELVNPVIEDGEFILISSPNTTTNKYDKVKIGDGVSTFSQLETLDKFNTTNIFVSNGEYSNIDGGTASTVYGGAIILDGNL